MSHPTRPIFHRLVRVTACAILLGAGVGCTLFRNMGTGEHLDAARDHPTNTKAVRKRDMLVEVTTDATGAVVSVQFKKSSGSDSIDNYVADTIQKTWPQVPSKTTLAELTYSVSDGFSKPREISSRPAP